MTHLEIIQEQGWYYGMYMIRTRELFKNTKASRDVMTINNKYCGHEEQDVSTAKINFVQQYQPLISITPHSRCNMSQFNCTS